MPEGSLRWHLLVDAVCRGLGALAAPDIAIRARLAHVQRWDRGRERLLEEDRTGRT